MATVTDSVLTEPQKGIFEYSHPQEVDTGEWMENHLDCDTIMDDLGQTLLVYAFTREPQYNLELENFQQKKYGKHYILKGISSDGLNSIF